MAASITRRHQVEQAEKVRENRLRRMAERQGFRLEKSRRRDPRALDYGTWTIVEPHTNTLVAGGRYGTMDLDAVEAWLTGDDRNA
jgi:hypothetical protein